MNIDPRFKGPALALAAALLFGASTPFAKSLLGSISPWLMAGLLYAGAGAGLLVLRLLGGASRKEWGVARQDWPWLLGAIVFGGGIGPVLLMLGLSMTDGATASLLLTLEGVFTALLAWLVFREHVHARLILGMIVITGGAAMLAWDGAPTLDAAFGPLLVASACLAWAIDNNLTRKVALNDAATLAMLKGLCAGIVNLALAIFAGAAMPPLAATLSALALGFIGYGLSLVCFVLALRELGTGRTGAYFSVAPFIGAALAITFFGSDVSSGFFVAGALIAIGVWLHLTEQHGHEHAHDVMAHEHWHSHDEHHQHTHGPDDPPGERHAHWHMHAALRHAHAHFPDAHHRHRHKVEPGPGGPE